MKTRFRLQALVVAALCITFLTQSCVKEPFKPGTNSNGIPQDPNGLPTYSEVGRGTFGFLLDGKAWLPGCSSWIDPHGAALFVDQSQITANDNCAGPIGRTLQLSMPAFSEGTFKLDDMGFDAYYIDYEPVGGGARKSYIASLKGHTTCQFEIKHYDAQKQILSGKFNLVLYRVITNWTPYTIPLAERDQYLDLNDSIIIKDGRFDVVHR
jgi:hypothetical protein